MDFRDLNGEPLSVGDPVTLVGNVFKQGYLNGANGTVIAEPTRQRMVIDDVRGVRTNRGE